MYPPVTPFTNEANEAKASTELKRLEMN